MSAKGPVADLWGLKLGAGLLQPTGLQSVQNETSR